MKLTPGEFLDEPEELHALVIGLCEVICPWPAYHRSLFTEEAQMLSREQHYYQLGRALGIFALLGIAGIVKLFLF